MLTAILFRPISSKVKRFQSTAYNANTTSYNANKAIQFDQDVAWFKSGWGGTHNFKFGYQLNRLSNFISQHANVPHRQHRPGRVIGLYSAFYNRYRELRHHDDG